MQWFGESWPPAMLGPGWCAPSELIATPLGQICALCRGQIAHGDSGFMSELIGAEGLRPRHVECHFAILVAGEDHVGGGPCRVCGGRGDVSDGGGPKHQALQVWVHYRDVHPEIGLGPRKSRH